MGGEGGGTCFDRTGGAGGLLEGTVASSANFPPEAAARIASLLGQKDWVWRGAGEGGFGRRERVLFG